jgi:hypothetical protein
MNYKKIFQISMSLILIILFLAACGSRSTTGKVEGRISRSDTNESISNVKITLTSLSSKQETEVITDDKGNYSFAELNPDKYGLSATWVSNCTKFGAIEDKENGWFGFVDNKKVIVITIKEAFEVAAGTTIEKNFDLSSCP